MNKSSLRSRTQNRELLIEAPSGKLNEQEILITPEGWMPF